MTKDNSHFGILADGLGEIPEGLATQLMPLPPLLASGNVLGEAIVSTDNPGDEHLLVELSVERIAMRLLAGIVDLSPVTTTPAVSQEVAPVLTGVRG
jgi:hypothetical protein